MSKPAGQHQHGTANQYRQLRLPGGDKRGQQQAQQRQAGNLQQTL
ncbi:hypothetical protein [Thalassolituus pacificus]|uniref:Uncharacterized protein n=1 Tax=Thalassolituus pacificus TaxID=2975440 RepID=A0A9X2WFH0_9GAMM|nr:hypothetical protein [Thalassolituus pacificus]MCT7359355.1 hypothetical protein [Thalassolituus pacificus]